MTGWQMNWRTIWMMIILFLTVQFMTDVTKYISSCMASLSALVRLELPHVNILSNMDLNGSSSKHLVKEFFSISNPTNTHMICIVMHRQLHPVW
ncbi:uncharacterized protein [Elaeis guineensis]|uniref:GPN-loop GTPase 3 n=1 Tax=Elaeis guineensis var. tenera TaxID=51953 RepID=A0A6I9S0Q4_ELAGV|nr:GPN-loop GTPase 3 [Elaeis guineensis]